MTAAACLRTLVAALLVAFSFCGSLAEAQKTYDSGASDTEIKVGNTAPYTGSFSEYSAEERAEAAYFAMIDARGGIHGRKITFISLDDGSDPAQTVALTHRLVERDKVLLVFSPFGTAPNLATRQYLNDNKIPQLFVQASSSEFDDPARYPWTMGFFATFRAEGAAYARYVLQTKPNAKIALLYGAGEATREYVEGVREGLGEKSSTAIVKEASFRYSEPLDSLDSQVEMLRDSGADVFLNLAFGRYATEAIAKAYDLGWHPLQLIPNASISTAAFLDPAGLNKAAGIVSNARSKGWLEPASQRDPAVQEFLSWMHDYNPLANLRDQFNVAGYERAQALVDVLTRCGDDLTRANVMRQAASLNLELGMLRPGITITTSPTDYQPIKQLYLIKFDGKEWVPQGAVIGS